MFLKKDLSLQSPRNVLQSNYAFRWRRIISGENLEEGIFIF